MNANLIILFACLLGGALGCDRSEGVLAPQAPQASGEGDHQRSSGSAARTDDLAGLSANERRDTDWFEDVTERSGVRFTYRSGRDTGHYYILEGIGGGVALVDYDRDDDLDVMLAGGGTINDPPQGIRGLPPALYRNDGDWRFVDVTDAAGLSAAPEYSHGCSVADFDQDGYSDLLLCCYGGCRLYHNLHDGRFRDVSREAQLILDGWNVAAAWGDVDADGWPDLFVARYVNWHPQIDRRWFNDRGQREVVGPTFYSGVASTLWHNQADGTFTDISHVAGLQPNGKALGVVMADVNLDGWLDIYVANDETPNHLYLGQSEWPLHEVGFPAGVATDELGNPEGSMGLDVGDYDGDGQLDIWVTNFRGEDNGLYRNRGDGSFLRATTLVGLAGESRRYVGWSTALSDFDHDGWLDLFVANGHVSYHDSESPLRQPAQLFRNVAGARFENVSQNGGPYFRTEHEGRGAAVGDLDNDGALDIVVVHLNEPVTILHNRQRPQSYVRVLLRATAGARDATGALVKAAYQDRQLVRCIRSGAGYGSHFDQRVTFPVAAGNNSVDVTVLWPGRTGEMFSKVPTGVTTELIEGLGQTLEPERHE